MRFKHFFLPHTETHRPAYLISKAALVVYISVFLTFNLSISFVERVNPDILGISADLNVGEIIRLTNVERQKSGLSELKEDSRLNAAAAAKAQNMFEENYWAHYSPSGKDPWGFILGSGYKFSYAGENLARNFYSSPEVVGAWMASPTHKDNIVNTHYKNVGIAVLEGTLNGQPTVLVVQEFGSPVEYLADNSLSKVAKVEEKIEVAQALASPVPAAIESPRPTASPIPEVAISQVKNTPLPSTPSFPTNVAGQKSYAIDPYLLMKNLGLSILAILMFLIALDLYIIRRRAVVRLTSHHLPHLALLILGISGLINLGRGTII